MTLESFETIAAIKAERDALRTEVERLRSEKVIMETDLKKRLLVVETENEWLKRAFSDIENWCVEFHETGPHDPEKALRMVMQIYAIAHEQALEVGM